MQDKERTFLALLFLLLLSTALHRCGCGRLALAAILFVV